VTPVDHELNLTMQAILTDASWGLTAALVAIMPRPSGDGAQDRLSIPVARIADASTAT
jgi:hypothetical protein